MRYERTRFQKGQDITSCCWSHQEKYRVIGTREDEISFALKYDTGAAQTPAA